MDFEDFGIFGFDLSWYQDVNATPEKVDFVQMKDYGASFAVIKAGQLTYADEDFADNWRNCKGVLPRSAYWFCDDSDSGQAQARRYWTLVKSDQPEGMLFADFETGSWITWNPLYNFINELQQLSGYISSRLGIYTGYYYWEDHNPPTGSSSNNWFKQFPLWIAAYAASPVGVKIPTPWTECLLWQDGTPPIGWLAGAESREIDHNRFNGDPNKFKEFMGGAATVPVPPYGGNVALYYADLKTNYTSYVRTGAGLNSPVITTIRGPLTVTIVSEKTTMDGYDWYQISAPTSGWIALTTSYTNFRSANPVPPANAPYPVSSVITMSDGTTYSGPVTKQ